MDVDEDPPDDAAHADAEVEQGEVDPEVTLAQPTGHGGGDQALRGGPGDPEREPLERDGEGGLSEGAGEGEHDIGDDEHRVGSQHDDAGAVLVDGRAPGADDEEPDER